jgi:hypothetical protein
MLNQWRLLYQISPIFLTNGIATPVPGGQIPLIALTNPEVYTALFSSSTQTLPASQIQSFNLDNAFGFFQPVAGGSLIEQLIAEYPFANLNVAANAIVRNPVNVSLIMVTPMKTGQAWMVKLATMTMIKNTLDNHNNAGGTYTVFTPSWTYTNMLMKGIFDVSIGSSPLPQNAWRWDFTRPLVSTEDAESALGNLMLKITNGVAIDIGTTTPLTAIGTPANSVNIIPGNIPPVLTSIPFNT